MLMFQFDRAYFQIEEASSNFDGKMKYKKKNERKKTDRAFAAQQQRVPVSSADTDSDVTTSN